MKFFLKISAKIILTFITLLMVGMLLAFYALQLPKVQSWAIERYLTPWVSLKLGSSVKIGRVEMKWLDELTLHDVLIEDQKHREMIYVKELYVNYKTNLSFDRKTLLKFDNNLDYVMIREPRVRLVYEPDGLLNIDKWIERIEQLTASTEPTTTPSVPFTIDEAYVQDGTFTLEDPAEKRFPKEEFDYYNFTVSNIQGNVNNLFILGDTISLDVHNMRAIEKRSNLLVKHLDTRFFFSKQHMKFDNLFGKVNNSIIRERVHFNFRLPHDFSDFNRLVEMDADLKDCEIDAQDLARFATTLYQYQEMYRLNGKFKGTVEDFRVKDFNLKFGKNSELDGEIAFKGMPDLETVKMDLAWKSSQIDAPDTRQYVGDSVYLKHVKKFGLVNFAGNFKGVYNDFRSIATIKSEMGYVEGDIAMKIPSDLGKAEYEGNMVVDNFELGNLINQNELLKKISFVGKIYGKGLTIKDAELGFDGNIKHIWFNGYDFKNIFVDGKMSQSVFDGAVSVKDTNLAFDVSGKVDFSKALNRFDIQGKLQNANLRPLGYSTNNVQLQSTIDLHFQGNELDKWIGNAQLFNTILQYQNRKLGIDSLLVTSTMTENSRKINLVSEFFNAEMTGNFTPSQVISDLTRLSKEYTQYFTENEQSRIQYYLKNNTPPIEPYAFNYEVLFKKSEPFFAYFYPKLFISSGSVASGKFFIDQQANLILNGKIDTLRHDDLSFYQSTVDFSTAKELASQKIVSSLQILSEKQKLSKMSATQKMEISALWNEDNRIDFEGKIAQQNGSNDAQIVGEFLFLPDGFDVIFDTQKSRLNLLGETWSMLSNNRISIEHQEIDFQKVGISNKTQRLELNGTFSTDSTKNSFVEVHNFDLQTLKPITEINLKGTLNGQLSLQNLFKNTVLTSDFHINELNFEDLLVGNIEGAIHWDEIEKKLNVGGNIVRKGNEIFKVSGTYDPQNENDPLNLQANLKRANLEIFQSFVKDIFSDVSGYATGLLTVRGKATNPRIRGSIDTEKGQLKVDVLNSYLYFDDAVQFTEEGFMVEKGFEVRDSPQGGNSAELEGGIYNGGNNNFMLGLHASIRNREGFKILNTTQKDNEDFYGVAYATGDVNILGDFENVVITGNLTSKRGTKITIPLDNETYVDTEEGGLKFTSKTTQKNQGKVVKKDSTLIDESGSLRMAFNFNITPEAECEVIFDRTNKDKLNAFGNGQLTIEYDTKGGFSMTGPYTIKNGKYDFSLQNIAALRKFDLMEGSWIRWSGNPYDADIDIKAGYTTNLMIDNLVQGVAATPELRNRYPVNAYVLLTGKLMIPTVRYDIKFNQRQIPMSLQPQVIAFEQRLRDDERLMTNNFVGISAMNRLFPDGSFNNAVDAQLLIDNFANIFNNQIGNLFNKIDPNLEVGVQFGNIRQNLLNNMQLSLAYRYNRMKVSLSNTILQDQTQQLQANNFFYGGELEYLLNEEGTWRLKGFSRNMPTYFYSTALQNNPTVFGVSIQHTRNFNSFFRRKPMNKFPIGVAINDEG